MRADRLRSLRRLALLPAVAAGLAAQAPAWQGRVELTIGAGTQPKGPYLFEHVDGLALDATGRIFVSESELGEVRVFSAEGKHLYTFGRRGEGPGDLGDPCCLALAKDGRLWIDETGNNRYSIFTVGPTKATFVRSLRKPPTNNGYGTVHRVTWDREGRVLDISGVHLADQPFGGILRAFLDSTGAIRRRDSVLPPPKDSLVFFTVETAMPGGVGRTTYLPYIGPRPLRAFGPDGELATAMSSRYAVLWTDRAGKRLALLQRDIVGPPLSAKDREAIRTRDSSIAQRIGKPLPFATPARKPVLADIGFDLDGRLWVRRAMPEGSPHEADLYGRDGRLLAVVTWPANVDLHEWTVRGQTGIGVATDDDGVDRVVRLRFGT